MSVEFNIPQEFVDNHYEKGKNCRLFGVEVKTLSKKELIAALHHAHEQLVKEREYHSKAMKKIFSAR